MWGVAGNFGRDRRSIASRWHAPTSAQDVLYRDLFPTTVHSVAPQIVELVCREVQRLPKRRRAQTAGDRPMTNFSSGAPSPGVPGAASGKTDTT